MTVAVFAAGAWYVYRHGDELEILTQVRIVDFLLVVVALAAVFIAAGYTFFLLVRATGVRLDPQEWIGLTLISNALNYLVPIRPGLVAKAAYLKRRATLPYSRFSSVLVARAVLFVGTTALLGLFLLVWLRPTEGGVWILYPVCALLVVLSLVPLYLPLFRFQRTGVLFETLNNALHGFEEIRTQRGQTLWIGLSIVLQHLLSGLVCMAAFDALGYEIGFLVALAMVAFASIANVLAITPNNIGIQELVMAYTYMMAGLDFEEGLVAAALVRAAHILLTFVLAPWFLYRLSGTRRLRLREMLSQENSLR